MKNIFLTLILPAFVSEPVPFTPEVLAGLDDLAGRHFLFPLLYVRLLGYHRRYPENEAVSSYLESRKPLFLLNAAASMKQEALEKKVLSLLDTRAIPALVIKGSALAKEIYQDPNCRASVDIDILIRIADAGRADAVLCRAGYVRTDSRPLGFWLHRLHHAQYRLPDQNRIVEIHWNFGIPGFFRLESETIWNEVIAKGGKEKKLSFEMTLILLLIHHHMHCFREFKILVDIVWAFHRYADAVDWPAFSETLVKIGLFKIARISLDQIKELWPELFLRPGGIKTIDEQLRKCGRAAGPPFLSRFFKMELSGGRISRIKDLIVYRFALGGPERIFFSFFKTVFPFPEEIKALYKDDRTWRLPVNYLKFIKWRINIHRLKPMA